MWNPMKMFYSSSSSKPWTLEELEVEDVQLKIDGKPVSIDHVKSLQGTSFVLQAGDNLLEFEQLPEGVKLTLNQKTTQVITEPLHLHISPQALCIGESCVMWPKPPPPQQQLAPTTTPVTEKPSWTFGDVEVEDVELKIDGRPVTVNDVKALQGTSFNVQVDDNLVSFTSLPRGVKLTLNDKKSETLTEAVNLHISPQAVCIGEACVMWPKPPYFQVHQAPSPTAPSTASTSPPSSDEQFLSGIKGKLGADYERLLGILSKQQQQQQQKPSSDHHEGGAVKRVDTKEQWESAFKAAGDKPIVVDCSATWCAPCKKIAPLYHSLAEQYASSRAGTVFLAVDIQTNAYVKQHYSVDQLPTFLFFRNGKELSRLIGDRPQELSEIIAQLSTATATATATSTATTTTSAPAAVKQQTTDTAPPSQPKKTHYNYVVIGGGSGGMASAKEAAKRGAHVALFDYVKPSTQGTKWGLGGTCVNVGCVPKKLMHYASLLGESIHDAKTYGWEVSDGKLNWHKLVENVQNHVKQLNFYYEKGLHSANKKTFVNGTTVIISDGSVTYYNAHASFVEPKTLSWRDDFGNTGTVTGDVILVSVGGRPFVPRNVPGVREHSITSDDLFSLNRVPGKTLCVGAGYISLECGGFLKHLGYEVDICVRSIPLRTGGFDRQCVEKVVKLMKEQGINFLIPNDVTKIEKLPDGKLQVSFVHVNTKETFSRVYDTVLYATGRAADTAELNLKAVGVNVTDRGTIPTDDHDRTNVSHIYAIGDVADGRPELTPVAVQAGEMLSRRLFAGSKALMNYRLVPTTVFTPFEYGMVGLSEEAAVSAYGADDVEVYLSEFSTLEIGAAHRRRADGEDFPTNSLSKLVCRRSDGRVVGFHFVGLNAGEMTQGFALSLRLGATKDDFDAVVGIHPTDAESFMSLGVAKRSGEAWESVGGCGGGKCG